jgi:hypothetical protein
MMIPITTGPIPIPKSENARNVPMAAPSEVPAYSKAYDIDTGRKKAAPIPQNAPTIINMGRVLEKESIIRETVAIEKQVIMSFSLLKLSKILPPNTRPAIIDMAMAEKKRPGFATPH